MVMDFHTLVCDQVKLSRFKIVEWCQGSVDPAETWWHGLIPKEFIQQRTPLDSKGVLRGLRDRLTSDVPYYHNCLWAFSLSSWSNEPSSQMCKGKTSRILCVRVYIYIQQSQVCAGSIPKSKLKRKISHSLIHMGFTGLVTWSGVRRPRKKGSERLKECLRVILSQNFEIVACTFIHFNFWVGLYSFCLIH